jgi:starvation-inducible DNA-binding protein
MNPVVARPKEIEEGETMPQTLLKNEQEHAAEGDVLSQIVTELLDLRLQLKQSHWNIAGPGFIGIHKLLDQLTEELDESIDAAAERERSLGFRTHSSARHIAENSNLAQISGDVSSIPEVVGHLVSLYKTEADRCKEAIHATQEEDPGTADLLTDTVRMLDQHRYLLGSNLGSR